MYVHIRMYAKHVCVCQCVHICVIYQCAYKYICRLEYVCVRVLMPVYI